jgi:hypothetical protein
MTVTTPHTLALRTPLPAGLTAQEQLAQRYDRLLGLLSDRVVNDAIGTSIPTRTRLTDAPQSRLWLGMLSSEPQLIARQARPARAGLFLPDRDPSGLARGDRKGGLLPSAASDGC